jgi:hypothetical protein
MLQQESKSGIKIKSGTISWHFKKFLVYSIYNFFMLFVNLEFISEFYNKFSGRGEIPYRRLKAANLTVYLIYSRPT